MPSTTPPVDSKSRQSSGGRSFFGRKIHKERTPDSSGQDDAGSVLQVPSASSSTNGSRSSRHSHRRPNDSDGGNEDTSGLSMTAGVLTSIPYDAAADGTIPIPVDYLPQKDQMPARRDPQPHQLAKGSDFHQYPAWDPKAAPANGSSHPTGPRPPPHTLKPLSGILPTRVSSKPQQHAGTGDSASIVNGNHGTVNSVSTGDTSSTHRRSFDQMSVMSSASSATRSSIFSSDNSSRTAVDSRPHTASRQSNHPGWAPQQPAGFSSTTSFNPEGFNLPRPTDDRIIEAQFNDLMHKRGWHNLPEQARRQMMAYPAAKKWTLVHNDRLTEWQGEQKRRQTARQTILSPDGSLAIATRSDEEGSPEWYVRRVMSDSITPKQLGSLSVSLRTQPIRWVFLIHFCLLHRAGMLHTAHSTAYYLFLNDLFLFSPRSYDCMPDLTFKAPYDTRSCPGALL